MLEKTNLSICTVSSKLRNLIEQGRISKHNNFRDMRRVYFRIED
ncbi:MAG: hypothetical protein ACFE8J_08740 [Candidatus Heimdallarchaeota archaeon]